MASDELTVEEAPLVVDSFPEAAPRSHTRDVHVLSTAFLLIFLAFGAVQNLETTLNTDDGLGTISLGVLYVSFMICSLFASPIVRKLGPRKSLIWGTSGYWLFVAANMIPNWYTMVPASIYLGFAASIIWVGQGTYLTTTGRSHARDNHFQEETVIGHFNGEFWAMFATHQFLGNIFSLLILKDGADGTTKGANLLYFVFLCIMSVGAFLMFFLRERDTKCSGSSSSPDNHRLKSIITPLLNRKMLLIIPLLAYSGLQQAYVWAVYTKDIVRPSLGEAGVGGAMVVYGAFDAICSIVAGRLTSGFASITWILSFGCIIHCFAFIWILLNPRLYPLVLGGFLGVGDGVLNTQIYAVLASLFKHDTEGAFAQLKLWQSASIAMVFFFASQFSLQIITFFMLAMLLLSLLAFILLISCVHKAFSFSRA